MSNYLGASEVINLINAKYKSQFMLAKEKLGMVEKKVVDNQYVRYGSEHEDIILNAVEEQGYKFDTQVKLRDDYYKLSGVVDGIDYNKRIILEIKTYKNSPSFQSYVDQLHLYFHLFKFDEGLLATYQMSNTFNKQDIELFKITKNEERLTYLLELIESFWKKVDYLKENPTITKKEFDNMK